VPTKTDSFSLEVIWGWSIQDFFLQVSVALREVFYVIEALVGFIEASMILIVSLCFRFVRALKVAEKVQTVCEFLCRDIVSVL
jgi:hypothetical protein